MIEQVIFIRAEEKLFHLVGHFILEFLELDIDGLLEQVAENLSKADSRLVLYNLLGYENLIRSTFAIDGVPISELIRILLGLWLHISFIESKE